MVCVVKSMSDMIDCTKLKRAVKIEITIVLNVCAVNRALWLKVRAITSIFSFGICLLSNIKMSFSLATTSGTKALYIEPKDCSCIL